MIWTYLIAGFLYYGLGLVLAAYAAEHLRHRTKYENTGDLIFLVIVGLFWPVAAPMVVAAAYLER